MRGLAGFLDSGLRRNYVQYLTRHPGEGRGPGRQSPSHAEYRQNTLDSGLRRNDDISVGRARFTPSSRTLSEPTVRRTSVRGLRSGTHDRGSRNNRDGSRVSPAGPGSPGMTDIICSTASSRSPAAARGARRSERPSCPSPAGSPVRWWRRRFPAARCRCRSAHSRR